MEIILIPTAEVAGPHPFETGIDLASAAAHQVRAWMRGIDEVSGRLGPRIHVPLEVVDAAAGSVLLDLSGITLDDTDYRLTVELKDPHGGRTVYESTVASLRIIGGSTGGGAWSGVERTAQFVVGSVTQPPSDTVIMLEETYAVIWPEDFNPAVAMDLISGGITYYVDYGAGAVVEASEIVGVTFTLAEDSAAAVTITIANYAENEQEIITLEAGESHVFGPADGTTIVAIKSAALPAPGLTYNYTLTAP